MEHKVILASMILLAFTASAAGAGIGRNDTRFAFMPAETAYDEAVALGVYWERPHPGPMVWEYIEVGPGIYDWDFADYYVLNAQGYDMDLLVTIWPFAGWDQESCHGSECDGAGFEDELPLKRCRPCNMTAYEEFVKNLVERYDGDGIDDMPGLKYAIKYWEASNEPSMQEGGLIFFKGTSAEYLDILNATYRAVKESDPEAMLLHGGMAGFQQDAIDFWNSVYSLGGDACFDIANIHSIGAGGEGIHAVAMKSFLDNHSIDKPFWITEIEYSAEALGKSSLTEDEWAQTIVRSFVYGLGNGAEKLFYVALKGNPGEDGPELITKDGIKNRAYYAFGLMVEKIDNYSSVEKIAETQYKFTVNNATVYVLWGSGELPAEISGTVSVSDVYGNASEREASTIELSENPVYVESATCTIHGDYVPCGTVTLSEVVSYINEWSAGQATLADVIALINAWAA